MKKLVTLICTLLLTELSFGAGFALYEFSGRSTAMGGAVIANKAEPASLALNPSLITELEGMQMQTNVTAVRPHATASVNGDARDIKDKNWFLPSLYLTHKWSEDISFGLGVFSRYGLGGTYENHAGWTGSYLAYEVSLETISITPELAIKANDQFSMAMGLEAMTIEFIQKLKNSYLDPTNPNKEFEMGGDGISWGGNFSLNYRPDWAPKWKFGAVYKTKIKHNMKGSFNTKDPSWVNNVADKIHMGPVNGAVNLPDSLAAGLSFTPTENLIVEAGIVGTFWSAYDQLVIEYRDTEQAPEIRNKKLYKDVYRLNLGAEYKINENWSVRGGYVYDKSPINEKAMDTLLPVDDRYILSVGAGYQTETWNVDLAYSHIWANDLKGHSHPSSGSLPMEYTNGSSDILALAFG
ncbi:MAG: outer membrane protein transport protein [Elusimicrobiaceae bacterium]|nr:outer membrane protein transport protein [Elusimicrobiaceae bacterium]